MNQPVFNIFSWRRPFLPDLKQFVMNLTDKQPGKAVIITPNRRPARYLTHLFAKDHHTGILPRMLTVNDLVCMWRSANTEAPLRVASTLDQAALLYDSMQEAALKNPLLAKHFGNMDLAAFLPWAMRIGKVLEDFNVAGRPLDNLPDLEGEVSAPAASILASLRDLGDTFTERLVKRGWTTRGHDHTLALKHIKDIPALVKPAPDRPVIVAGFYMPDYAHELLLKELWEEGAHICLHTDPALVTGGNIDIAARGHQKWMKRWNASPVLFEKEDSEDKNPEYSFFAGYDLHSQLGRLDKILASDKDKSTAIILGKPESLMPTLQNLPPENLNISMGYPMERSRLAHLLEDLLALGQNRKDEQSWSAEKILKVLRHPFMAMAKTARDKNSPALAASLRSLDYEIRKAGRYWRPDKSEDPEAQPARHEIENLARLFSSISTLAEMGTAIKELVEWLVTHGGKPWANAFPLDAEALYRLENEIVPALVNNELANEKFSLPVLANICQNLIREQRIPFDADPIEGLQVMGLLESRLLHFDRIIFLDATDDVLPGSPGPDPLLPDYLRRLLDLPDNERREALAAHNLRRLVAGAENAHFIWQEGKGGAGEGKRMRSRFIEQLLWEKEKKNPDIIKNGIDIVERPVASLQTRQQTRKPIQRSPQLDKAISAFWKKPLSPTLLDGYLASPSEFIRSNVLGLDEHDRSLAGPAQLTGEIVHKILSQVYAPAEHEEIRKENDTEIFAELVEKHFNELSEKENLAEKLPPDVFISLQTTVPLLLKDYRKNQPDSTWIVDLEQPFTAELELNGKKFNFNGKFDRLDQRNGRLYLTDYKTGKPQDVNRLFWENDEFFTRVRDACDANDFAAIDALFAEMRQNIQSIQLPLYLLLLAKSGYIEQWGNPANAALVYLRGNAAEENIFETDLTGLDDRRLEHCLNALELIEAHMRLAPEFADE